MTTPAYRAAATWIGQALASLSEAIERLPDGRFLAEHQAVHDEPRSAIVDIVTATLEREWWRRWPEGRGDDRANPGPPKVQGAWGLDRRGVKKLRGRIIVSENFGCRLLMAAFWPAFATVF